MTFLESQIAAKRERDERLGKIPPKVLRFPLKPIPPVVIEVKEEPAVDTVVPVVAKFSPKPLPDALTTRVIVMVVARYYGTTATELYAASRITSIIRPRHIAMYLARELTDLSFPQLGMSFGRDYTTIMHAHGKIKDDRDRDPTIDREVTELTAYLMGGKNASR